MKKVNAPKQLQLFDPVDFVVVDPLLDADCVLQTKRVISKTLTMERFAMLHVDTVLERLSGIGESADKYQQWSFYGIDAMVTPKRLHTFNANLSCVCCGRKGNVFLVEQHVNETGGQYINLYSQQGRSVVLMTVDHVLPDSLGGRYAVTNFETRCRPCNQMKTNVMSEDEIARVRADKRKFAKEWVDHAYLDAVLNVQLAMATAPSKEIRNKIAQRFDAVRKRVNHNSSPKLITDTIVVLKRISNDQPAPVSKKKAVIVKHVPWSTKVSRMIDQIVVWLFAKPRFGRTRLSNLRSPTTS